MKTAIKFFTIILSIVLFTGCAKNTDVPLSQDDQNVKSLTGDGNRYWHLKQVFQNDVEQTLTNDQLKYTKTYTINPAKPHAGSFTNSDGYKGVWTLNGDTLLEIIENNQAGPVQITYLINEMSANKLDMYYVLNLKKTREVYYAY